MADDKPVSNQIKVFTFISTFFLPPYSGAHSMTFHRIENEHLMLQLIELLLFCSPLGEPAIDLSQLKFMWCNNAGCLHHRMSIYRTVIETSKNSYEILFLVQKCFLFIFWSKLLCTLYIQHLIHVICPNTPKNIILVFVHLFANGMAFLTCLRCYTHE